MKYICLLALTVSLLLFGACAPVNNVPRHTADEVITIAKSFSSDCKVPAAPDQSHH
jgi:hypothetical protein